MDHSNCIYTGISDSGVCLLLFKLILILNIFMIVSCFGVRSKHSKVPLNPNGGDFSLSIMTFNILASIDLKSKHDGYGS